MIVKFSPGGKLINKINKENNVFLFALETRFCLLGEQGSVCFGNNVLFPACFRNWSNQNLVFPSCHCVVVIVLLYPTQSESKDCLSAGGQKPRAGRRVAVQGLLPISYPDDGGAP